MTSGTRRLGPGESESGDRPDSGFDSKDEEEVKTASMAHQLQFSEAISEEAGIRTASSGDTSPDMAVEISRQAPIRQPVIRKRRLNHWQSANLKFRNSEKVTKFWKNLPVFYMLLSNVKLNGKFCGLLRIYEVYKHIHSKHLISYILFGSFNNKKKSIDYQKHWTNYITCLIIHDTYFLQIVR